MRVLFLGNSFTYYHDLPVMAGKLLSCRTASVTRGGAYLRQFADPGDELFHQAEEMLGAQAWDYVVLQEQSLNPVICRADFFRAVSILCARVRHAGAQPLLYATWPYREGGKKLASVRLGYGEMLAGLKTAYEMAGERNGACLARVGEAFDRARTRFALYEEDDYHPSLRGSYLAACAIARALAPGEKISLWHPEEITGEEADMLRRLSLEEREKMP